jgi:hypothetical protein
MKSLIGSVLVLFFLGVLSAFSPVQDKAADDAAKQRAASILAQKGAYPLTKCPVSGEELGATAVDTLVDARLVRLCCENCVEPATKDKEAIFKSIDAAVVAQQSAGYPLDTCLISGEKLGDKAVAHVQGTYLMKLCCKDCVAEVKKDPASALKKLQDAYIAKQKATYPLETCIVTDEPLGSMGEPLDYLWGTRMYRLCCGGCKKGVQKNADKLWAKIETARASAKAK